MRVLSCCVLRVVAVALALPLPAIAGAAEEAAAPARISRAQVEARRADAESRFVEIDGVRLHYKDEGSGAAILLIHGSMGDVSDWDGWARVLAPRHRVIRFDLPGFGISGPIANGNYSIDRSQSLVDGLMDRLGIERFAIAGVSYGGPVAFRYAATRTGRVTALVIMNSAGVEYGKQRVDPKTGEKDYYKAATSSTMSRDYVARALRESFTDPRLVTESLVDRKYDLMNVEGRDLEAATMIAQYVRGEPERVLSHVRAPTLVLWGGAEKSLSQETADRFAAALTDARVVRKVVQPGGSHIMHVEMPEPTARAVAAFLEEFPDAAADAAARAATIAPLARAEAGVYRGVAENATRVFRGIRYAAPPVGALRWRPPQELPHTRGTQDATQFGAVCPQAASSGYAGFLAGRTQSEDCLTLNVWSGAAPPARKPVMVFLHPGGFSKGSGSFDSFDGTSLVRQGVVVVTLNYRLGVLGFFAHPALTRAAPVDEPLASFALLDQIAALRWVKRNIAAFGGDPGNVTIFGMSAGAQSVNYLMATPAARGLFHRAISESSAIHMFRPYRLREASGGKPASEEMGRQLAAARGIDDGPDAAARLRQVPVEWLLDYQARHLGGMYEPVIDGRLLRESVGEAFRAGREAPVPYLAGATNWEGSLSASFGSKDATRRLESLNMSRDDARRLHGDLDDETLQQRLDTDAFLGSQRWLVRRHAANGYPSWLYYFTYTLQAHRGEFPGAPHGGEVRYVFGTLDGLARIQDRPMGSIVSPADRDMAATVSGYWVSMATSGDPNGGGRPVWPACTPADDASLELGVEVRARRDMLGERMRFIEARLDAGDI